MDFNSLPSPTRPESYFEEHERQKKFNANLGNEPAFKESDFNLRQLALAAMHLQVLAELLFSLVLPFILCFALNHKGKTNLSDRSMEDILLFASMFAPTSARDNIPTFRQLKELYKKLKGPQV
jgi:hypothetical protein